MLYRRTWEKARDEVKHYNRREPEKSSLYRIVYTFRDELPRVWEQCFQSQYGVLRDEVLQALDEYLNCGLLCHGAARAYCDSCNHSILIAFSCKKRGICPSCSAKRAVVFAEHLCSKVLAAVLHRHVVFSIPKRLRAFFRYDRALNDILFHAAWESILEHLGHNGTPAAVLTLQTNGEALNWNPHLHGALASGVFSYDETFIPFRDIDTGEMRDTFQNLVLAALHKQELIDDGTVEQILSQQHSGFSVWIGEPFGDAKSKHFVARYIERGPVSLEKLSIQDDIVSYTTNDGKTYEFDGLEFLALLTSHIPNKWESTTRYYGYYSCRSRGERAGLSPPPTSLEQLPEPVALPSKSWAACMKQLFELNPLECPKCKSEMRIISFIQNTSEINKIMRSLDIPDPKMPDQIPRAPPVDDLFTDEVFDQL